MGVVSLIYTESIRKNFQFKYIYDHGKSFADRCLVVFVARNNMSKNRLGICVSKKIGKSYIRSRITRLIRENYRLNETAFRVGFDIVFMARKDITNLNFYQIRDSIMGLSRKHKIVL